jgi:2-polyprenyl-6-methoxyphenol hydroxylase-like FAD-dependent oxidoreductase
VPLTIADMHGNVKLRQDNDGDTDRPEIDRRDLRLMLLGAVPKEKIQWGRKIKEVQKQDDGKMAVRFTNGSTESGIRLVVGADGAWSKCRRLVSFLFLLSRTFENLLTNSGHVNNTPIRRKILHH